MFSLRNKKNYLSIISVTLSYLELKATDTIKLHILFQAQYEKGK